MLEAASISNTNATTISGTGNFVQADEIMSIGSIYNQNYNISVNKTNITDRYVWRIKQPVDSFTGRTNELKLLHEAMQRNHRKGVSTVISQNVFISGLGGVGKSELAKKYAYEYEQDYDKNVIWIHSENYETLKKSFRELAMYLNINICTSDNQEKDIKLIVDDMYNYFSKNKSLFIFDNAEKYKNQQEDEGIENFLPTLPHSVNRPYIIITSRNQKWPKEIQVLQLGTFNKEEAIEFIRKTLDIKGELETNEIEQLAETLQFFPLALQQAVCYIKEENEAFEITGEKYKISDYLEEYEKEAAKLLNFKFPDHIADHYTKTTFTTWKITLEKIKQIEHGHLGIEIIEILAYFAPDNIPIEVFYKFVNDKRKLRDAVSLLKQYSMVSLESEKSTLNVHRLLQQVIRLGLKEQEEKETLKKGLNLLRDIAEEASFKSMKCVLHTTSVWNYVNKYKELIQEFNQLPSRLVINLRDAGRYEEAYKLAVKTENFLKNELGEDDPSTLMIQHIIATIQCNKGQYDEALKLYEKVYEKRTKELGQDHLDTLTSRHNMGSIRFKQGLYDEAYKLYQEVYEKQKEILENDHPDTLTTLYSVFITQIKRYEYIEALQHFKVLSDKLKEILNNGTKILELYQAVYKKQKDLVEPDTKVTTNKGIYMQYKEILEMYNMLYEGLRKIHGPDNLHVLKIHRCVAKLLHQQGKYEEAIKEYQEVYDRQKEVIGLFHPDNLEIQHNIALVLDNQGKYEEALNKYQQVYEKQKEVLGSDHPDTLQTQYNMNSIGHKNTNNIAEQLTSFIIDLFIDNTR